MLERLTSQKIKKVVINGYEVDLNIQAELLSLGGKLILPIAYLYPYKQGKR